MKIVVKARNAGRRSCFRGRSADIMPAEAFVQIPRFPRGMVFCLALVVSAMMVGVPAYAQLTVTPITWDVVGLDHNRPLTSGPQYFPVGAQVCSDVDTTNVVVEMVWNPADPGTYINTRPGSLATLTFNEIKAGECVDAYFEIELTRSEDAFGATRRYTIEATDTSGTESTPADRQIYIAPLVSQNRNSTTSIYYGTDKNALQELGGGGTLALAVGNTYFIELTTETSTAYEEIQSFLTLSNTIFQVLSVETTYETRTAPESRVPDPNDRLWGDGCLWDSRLDSPNYNSCLSSGKVGGVVTTLYEIKIISGGGESVGLEALIYDRSGGSFHYNTDYSQSPGEVVILNPFAKQFIPRTIAADYTATLRFTITNPGPAQMTGYNFIDDLPSAGLSQIEVATTPNATTIGCGSPTFNPSATDTSLSFSNGTIDPYSTCTILVDVTVPAEDAETYPLLFNNEADLKIGADVVASASGSLSVIAEPPQPQDCDAVANAVIAKWTSFTLANDPNHPPTTPGAGEYGLGVGTAKGGGVTTSVDNNNRWIGKIPSDSAAPDKLGNARSSGYYFEFIIDTEGLDSVNLSFVASRQNNNAPSTVTLDYGPSGSLTLGAQTWGPVSTSANSPSTFSVSGLTNLSATGNTYFRFYIYNAANSNQDFRIHSITFTGTGEICTPIPPDDQLDPPQLSKSFDPAAVGVGQVSTLTFSIANPNTDDPLTGVTFRDELPAGMTAVSGTFVNNCGGTSSWGLEGGDDRVLLFTGGELAARGSGVSPAAGSICTLTVDVVSTLIGQHVNISDPVDAEETIPGGGANDTIQVVSAPRISKFFDPDLLLLPDDTTRLTFRIANNDPVNGFSSVAFTDVLPSVGGVQMTPATPSPLAYTTNGNCGAGHSFTWTSDTSTLSFSNGSIQSGQICEIYLDVTVNGVTVPADPVEFSNETGVVSHVVGATTFEGNTASAALLVDNPIPGIILSKQVGTGSNPDGTWYERLSLRSDQKVYWKFTIENIGETALTDIALIDDELDVSGCTWSDSLPIADADNPNAHIAFCIVGPVTAGETILTNTAIVTAKFLTASVEDEDSASYEGVSPTAVIMGQVDLDLVSVSEFLRGIGAEHLDAPALQKLLRTWDPGAGAWLAGARRDSILAALGAYLDPDGDGRVVVLRWETIEERGTIGFYAERRQGGAWVKINAEMLPGLIAAPMGAQYWLADPGARPDDGYQYRLIEVEATGTTREYGPFDLRVEN